MRIIAYLLLVFAAVLVTQDAMVFLDRGVFPATPIGQVWATIDRWLGTSTLLLLEPGIVRHLHPALWDWIVFPLLQRSAALVAVILAVAIFYFRWRARRRRARSAGFSMKRPGPR